jgi:hypothetical protein
MENAERWVYNLMIKVNHGIWGDVYTILVNANQEEYKPALLVVQRARPELYRYIVEARQYAMSKGLIEFSKEPIIDARIIDILARTDLTVGQAMRQPPQNTNSSKYYTNLFNRSYPELNVMQKIRIFSKEWLNKNLTNKSPKKIAIALHPDKNPNRKHQSEVLFKKYVPILRKNRNY